MKKVLQRKTKQTVRQVAINSLQLHFTVPKCISHDALLNSRTIAVIVTLSLTEKRLKTHNAIIGRY